MGKYDSYTGKRQVMETAYENDQMLDLRDKTSK